MLAQSMPGSNIELGEGRFSSVEASIYTGFWLTFMVWVWWDFAIAKKVSLDKYLFNLGFFLFVNTFSLWVLSRFSGFTEFEIKNYVWILIIGMTVTLCQKIAWNLVVNQNTRK